MALQRCANAILAAEDPNRNQRQTTAPTDRSPLPLVGLVIVWLHRDSPARCREETKP